MTEFLWTHSIAVYFVSQLTDFKNYATATSLKETPKLERSIALFNGLSQWIQCMVLSKTTAQQRASVIVKFVEVAKVGHICQMEGRDEGKAKKKHRGRESIVITIAMIIMKKLYL